MKAKNELHKINCWINNNINITTYQNEGIIKSPVFILCDGDKPMDLSDCTSIFYKSVDNKGKASCIEVNILSSSEGKVELPISGALTTNKGVTIGEIDVVTSEGSLAFGGVNIVTYSSVANQTIEKSDIFSALTEALAKVGMLTPEGTIAMDTELSDTSNNPLANKTITKAVNDIKTEVDNNKSTVESLNETVVNNDLKVEKKLEEKLSLSETENILILKTGVYNLSNGIVIAIDDNQLITVSGTATKKSYFNLLDMTEYNYTGNLPADTKLSGNYFVNTFDGNENEATYFVKDNDCNFYAINKPATFKNCSAFGLSFAIVGKNYNYTVKMQITKDTAYDEFIPPRKISDIYKNELLKIDKRVNLLSFNNYSQHYTDGDLTVIANGNHISITSNSAVTTSYGITIPLTAPVELETEKYYTVGVQNIAIASYEGNVSNISFKTDSKTVTDENGKSVFVSGYLNGATYPIVKTTKFAGNQVIKYVSLWVNKGSTINTEFDIQLEEGAEQSVVLKSVKLDTDKAVSNAFAETKLESVSSNIPIVNFDSSRKFEIERKDIFNYPQRICFGGEYLSHWYEKIYSVTENATIDLEGDSITEGYNSENNSGDAFKDMRSFAIKRIMKAGNYPLDKLVISNNGKGSRTTNEWVGTQSNYYYESDKATYPNGIIDNDGIKNADLVICAYGMNDAALGVSESNKSVTIPLYERLQTFENNYREALQRIRGSESVNNRPAYSRGVDECSIILCTPTCASNRSQRYLQNWHQYARNIIFKLADEFQCAVCDFTLLTPKWSNPDYTLWSTYDSKGGKTAIHPNKANTMFFTSALADLVYPVCLHNIDVGDDGV